MAGLTIVFTAPGCGAEKCAADCSSGTGASGAGGSGGGDGGSGSKLFSCKGPMCDKTKEYCQVQQDDVDPDVGTCFPLPQSCSPSLSCACIEQQEPGCTCQVMNGEYSVFCPPVPPP